MTSTSEPIDMTLYADTADYDAVRRGREYSKEDMEKFFCFRNFINAAYFNVVRALNDVIHAKGIPDETMFGFSFYHGREDSDDNHSDTMEQLWSLGYKYNDNGSTFTFWFPAKLFWKRRVEIQEWFTSEGVTQIENFKKWLVAKGILNETKNANENLDKT